MAFCSVCGTQMADGVAFCPGCGRKAEAAASGGVSAGSAGPSEAYRSAPPATPAQAIPISADEAKSFLSALFDISFTSFVTTKLIKVLFVLLIVICALMALGIAASGFSRDTGAGVLSLVIVAPIVFFLGVIYSRVLLEIIIVIFRMAEHLAEIAERGRRPA